MEIKLNKRDVLLLCVILSISFFLLGLVTKDVIRNDILPVSKEKLVPIYKVDTQEKKIAITLDGMWGANYTPKLLDIFRKNDINITFFFGGNWLEEYPHLVKEIVANGHEIGNHSYTHPHMARLSRSEMKEELNRTEELIKKLVDEQPKLFRPPFGEYNNKLIEVCQELDYYPIQWSIDSHDWMDVSSSYIKKRILNNVEPGVIILMHNNAQYTPQVLERIIPILKEKGYNIVPVSKLIYHDNYYIESHSGVQKRIRREE